MTKAKIIKKSKLAGFIGAVRKNYTFLGPVEEDGNIVFKEISRGDQIALDYLNSKTNPKDIFMPQAEVLCTFKKEEIMAPPLPEGRFVVFGMRPCDVQGLLLIDKVYGSDDFKDVYYLKRRENGLIVSLACNEPSETCFCSAIGGGPANEEGSDVIAFDLGDSLLFKSLTGKGEAFLKDCGSVVSDAKKTDLEKAAKISTNASSAMKTKINTDAVKKSLDNNFENPFWEEIHRRCIGCGICTYLCPTCYCFDITDEVRGPEGQRLRSWDSCMFRLFTLHASGHNPRQTGRERFRQRVMHKFKYLVDNCSMVGCTGCGRCVRECPVNLDIRAIVNEIARLE